MTEHNKENALQEPTPVKDDPLAQGHETPPAETNPSTPNGSAVAPSPPPKTPADPNAETPVNQNAEAPVTESSESSAEEAPQEKAAERDPILMQERIERMRRKQEKKGKVPQVQQDDVSAFFSTSKEDLDKDLDRELEEAMGGMSDAELYGDLRQPRQQQTGPPGRKKGKIISIHGPDVFVELPGNRSEGVLPIMQFPEGKPEIGTEVEVDIEGYDPANGLLILTRKGAAVEADWSTVARGMTVEARVVETNKGGLTVDVNGLRGFMPISQIDIYRVEDPEKYVGERLLCLVSEADPDSRNLVVSRRDLLEREREEKREALWAELAEGQIREGIIRNVKNFGAFVDLGGVDGLIPIGEMSWKRIKDPSEIVEVGQKVKVVVLRIDREARRLSLGLKQLAVSPWDDIESKYPEGTVVMGKVTKLLDFGAIVELEPAIDGLVHISELAPHRVNRITEVVQLDQEVKVQILNIDKERRRISLSIKGAMAQEVAETEDEDEVAEETAVKPSPKPRTYQLRGGIGGGGNLIPPPDEEAEEKEEEK